MSTTGYIEASLVLESRLVAFLQTLSGAGLPLDTRTIYPGHSDIKLDNVTTYAAVMVERADTQPYWQGSLEICEVKVLVMTQADDPPPTAGQTPLVAHNTYVKAIRDIFDLRNFNDQVVDATDVPGFKTTINATAGFGLSGWKAGNPPLEDGFSEKRSRQALFRFQALCGLEST